MIPTYGRILSAIEKALQKFVEKYQEVGKSLWDLVEGQERNTAQLERIGAMIEQRWSSEREVRKGELHHPPPVRLVVLCFSFFNRIYFFCELNV